MRDPDGKVAIVAGNLRVDAATAEVMRALAAEDMASVLLKGPALAAWLYTPDEPRAYRDCDLLVAPEDFDATLAILESLGFLRLFDDGELPAWWQAHAVEGWRALDGVTVDVHRAIPCLGVTAAEAWPILTAKTRSMTVANATVAVLDLPARALHVALHAAHHGAKVGRPLEDLDRAVAQLGEPLWRAAAGVAERLDALAGLRAGLCLTPAGRELATRLRLTAQPSVAARLQATTPPPVALGLEQLARADGLRARWSIVRAKVVPPASYVRRWHPIASRGHAGLAFAYLYRPLWILRSTPRALRAWRQARRDTARP